MELRSFTQGILKTKGQNTFLRWILIAMVISNLLLAISAMQTQSIVTIMPPKSNAEVAIAKTHATDNYIKAWGMYIADLLGSVKPGRGEFILGVIKPLLDPSIYREVTTAIRRQARVMKRNHIVTEYTVRDLKYKPSTNTVWVTGVQVSKGPGSQPFSTVRTYELTIDIVNYRPVLRSIEVYNDKPRIGSQGKEQ